MTIRYVVSFAALVGLTACGGGGAGNLANPIDLSDFPNATYGEMDTAADFLNGYKNSANADPSSFPGGTVVYNGVILMAEDLDADPLDMPSGVSPDGIIGQVQLIADFADVDGDFISGTATNFYRTGLDSGGNPDGNQIGSQLSGSLDLSASGLTGNFFELSATGTVDGDTVAGTFDDNAASTGGLVPGFKTLDASGLWVRTSDGSQLTVNSTPTWDGVIAAER